MPQLAPKPVQYNICKATDVGTLTSDVQKHLNEGWQPHGDLHIVHGEGQSLIYVQAVVRVILRPIEVDPEVEQMMKQQGQIVIPQPILRQG